MCILWKGIIVENYRNLLKGSHISDKFRSDATLKRALAIEVKIIFPATIRPDAKGTGTLSVVARTFRLGASAANAELLEVTFPHVEFTFS